MESLFLLVFPLLQDFWNSQAQDAAGGLEALHQSLPVEEHTVAGTIRAGGAAAGARSGRHHSPGGQRGQSQAVKQRPADREAGDVINDALFTVFVQNFNVKYRRPSKPVILMQL